MSNKEENKQYQYDFDFSNNNLDLLTDSTGKSEEYITNLNSKLKAFMNQLKEKLNEDLPSKPFMDKFLSMSKEEHTGTLSDTIKDYLVASSENTSYSDSLSISKIMKTITENFSPEELVFICANNFKTLLSEVIAHSISKDLLTIPTKMNLTEEEEDKFIKIIKLILPVDNVSNSELLSTRGFNHIIVNTLI